MKPLWHNALRRQALKMCNFLQHFCPKSFVIVVFLVYIIILVGLNKKVVAAAGGRRL